MRNTQREQNELDQIKRDINILCVIAAIPSAIGLYGFGWAILNYVL